MSENKFADKLRTKSASVQSEAAAEQARVERRERRQAARHTREYVAEHQGRFIVELTQRAEEAAEAGNTHASIKRTVGKNDNQGLRKSMEGVRDHFIEEGFEAQTTHSDNFHFEYFGSDGETPVWPTQFTHGVEISWAHEEE